tara:strand:+ start:669 stop:917 length:249 start_codon:yes stop_codon:yes gene_type:complete
MNKNINLEDYIQFFDTDKFQISTNLLRDYYEYTEEELNQLFENEIPPNLVLQRDPDSDLWELAEELWIELTNTKLYLQKYGY